MFSASKLYQSFSICGPSATVKPISAKIAATSSVTCETGWIVPWPRLRDGKVTSSHSLRRRSSSAASARPAFLAFKAELISSFSAFSFGPATWRSSGVILPSSRIFKETSPFLPTAAMRKSSSAASSVTFAIASIYFCLSASIGISFYALQPC